MRDLDLEVNFGKAAFISVANAVSRISPGAQFVHRGTEYDGLEWLEPPVWEGGKRKPSRQEVEEELKKLEVEWENTNYQRYRALEYPSIQDQLDTLYHQGYDGWKEEINKVKEQYPKPGA